MNIQQFLKLRPGGRYTLWFFSEFGYPCTAHIKLQGVRVEPYAKYTEAITLLFVPKGKKIVRDMHVIPGRTIAIWPSWRTIDAEKYLNMDKLGDAILESRSCIKNYMDAALKAAKAKPIAFN